jgi:hypothetical protein
MTVGDVARHIAALGAAAAISLTLTTTLAAGVEEEAQIAADYAERATRSATLGEAKRHLRHTVNCLVGPEGATFDSNELNPCEEVGNGAIPDAADEPTKRTLESALAAAISGMSANEINVARNNARKAANLLKSVRDLRSPRRT